MNFGIVWASRAKIEFAALLLHLKTDFGDEAVQDCIDEVERMMEIISRFPFLSPPFQGKPIRRCVVNHTTGHFYFTQRHDDTTN